MKPFDDLDAALDEDLEPGATSQPRAAIVVVDDDESVRQALNDILGERFTVTPCASAEEGVAAVNDETCAVVLDVKMPIHDGFWACDQIRKKAPNLPVIFYSAYQDLKDPFAIINEHRPFGYLTKDGNLKQLLSMLEAAVRLYQMTLHTKQLVRRLRRGDG